MYTVYEHISPNGKRYVGITRQSLAQHFGKNGIQYKSSNRHFWNAIQKYGWDNFQHNVIATGLTHEQACEIEMREVSKDKAINNSYNITDGGDDRTGTKHTDETKAKISASKIGKKICRDYSHIPNEVREKISRTLTGYKHGSEMRQKCSTHARNRMWVHKGTDKKFVKKWEIDAYLNSGWVLGTGVPTIHNEEIRKKIGIKNKGKIITPEQRAQISATLKAKPKTAWVNKDGTNKRVLESEINSWLDVGWVRGRIYHK